MKRFVLTLVACLLGIAAPAAAAPPTNSGSAPTGNSGVNQYVESIPTDNGNRPTNSLHSKGNRGKKNGNGNGGAVGGGGGAAGGGGGTSGGSTTAGSSNAISQSTQRALSSHGADGRAAAAVAISTAPAPFGGGQGNVSGEASLPSGSAVGGSDSGAGSSALGSVVSVLTGSASNGGMGAVLPVILVVVLIGSAGMAVLRRRRHT